MILDNRSRSCFVVSSREEADLLVRGFDCLLSKEVMHSSNSSMSSSGSYESVHLAVVPPGEMVVREREVQIKKNGKRKMVLGCSYVRGSKDYEFRSRLNQSTVMENKGCYIIFIVVIADQQQDYYGCCMLLVD